MSPLQGTLTSPGWTDWPTIRDLLGDDPCLWVDLTGAHERPAPPTTPIATHLWSWRARRLVRVRIEGPRALPTILTLGQDNGGQRVTLNRTNGIPWQNHDRAAPWHRAFDLVTTEGMASITFVTPTVPQSNGPAPDTAPSRVR